VWFTAHASVRLNDCECTAPFEVPDETLAGLDETARENLLAEEAMHAVYDSSLVEIWYSEGADET
jgi:hypothetical protein